MIFRLLAAAGLFGFGFLLGRELGRAEAIRDRLAASDRTRRVKGQTLESDDYIVLDDTQAHGSARSDH
jgi:hypothetical protein